MQRLIAVIVLCLLTFPALCQSTSKYQIGFITEVKPRPAAGGSASDPTSYDISVKVGDTIYVVLYTSPIGVDTVKYVAGRDLLVLVGKDKITYNDILGQSYDVPIESHRPAAKAKQTKSVSGTAE